MLNLLEDKLKGCFYGLIIGDAMGAPVEFLQPCTFEPVTTYRSGGPHNVRIGEWTDDTSMALAIADALIQCKGKINLEFILGNFVSWLYDGHYSSRSYCFDVGGTTRKAIANYQHTKSLVAPTNKISESGNGSLMRMAPIFFSSFEDLIDNALAVSRTTHTSIIVDEYVIKFTNLIKDIISGIKKEELKNRYQFNHLSQATGFVIDSYNVALCSFFTTDTFEEGLLLTVNKGLDADTVGAIYGQIAGAYYGRNSIPQKLISELYLRDMIENYIDRLWNSTFDLHKMCKMG